MIVTNLIMSYDRFGVLCNIIYKKNFTSFIKHVKPMTTIKPNIFLLRQYIYIFISPQMVDNKQYEKKNKNKQK